MFFFPAESGPLQQMGQINANHKHNDLEGDTYMSASTGTAATTATAATVATAAIAATAATTASSATTATAATSSLVRCPCGMLYFRVTGYEKSCSQCTASVSYTFPT